MRFVNLGTVKRRWRPCIVGHCTFEGTNAVLGIYSEWFYYCDEHMAYLSLPADRP